MSYEDEEEFERIRRWWNENWKAVVGGLVIGIVAIVGWRSWTDSRTQAAANASLHFDQLVEALDRNDVEAATALRETLVSDYRRTPYAALASLRLARTHVEAGDLARATQVLEWAASHATDEAVKATAQLRLARVQWAAGDGEAALRRLDAAGGADPAQVEELRGDVLLSLGRRAEARAAYERASAAMTTMSIQRGLLERKLEDLSDAVAS